MITPYWTTALVLITTFLAAVGQLLFKWAGSLDLFWPLELAPRSQ